MIWLYVFFGVTSVAYFINALLLASGRISPGRSVGYSARASAYSGAGYGIVVVGHALDVTGAAVWAIALVAGSLVASGIRLQSRARSRYVVS